MTAGDPPRLLRAASSTETPPFLRAALEESQAEVPEAAQLEALSARLGAAIASTTAVRPAPPRPHRTILWAVVAFIVAVALGAGLTAALWPSPHASPPRSQGAP